MNTGQVFISYSHADSEWVRQFAESLKKSGVKVWLDVWELALGDSLRDAIESGLRKSDWIITILTPENISRPSVYFEMGAALGMGKTLIPVLSEATEASKIPFDLRTRQFLRRGDPEETAQMVVTALKESKNKIKSSDSDERAA